MKQTNNNNNNKNKLKEERCIRLQRNIANKKQNQNENQGRQNQNKGIRRDKLEKYSKQKVNERIMNTRKRTNTQIKQTKKQIFINFTKG